jgi:hypothetical protein
MADSMEKFVVQSAILIATHQVLPFDMAIIDTCDGQQVFSFLSVEWAVIADVDCDSEKYRFLGNSKEASIIFLLSLFQVRHDLRLKPSNALFVSTTKPYSKSFFLSILFALDKIIIFRTSNLPGLYRLSSI